MTPFMLRVAEYVGADEDEIDHIVAPMPATRISQKIAASHGAADHASLSGCKGYLCGPPLMVEAALKTLMSKRLFPRDIYREEFFNEGDKAAGVNSPLIKR